MNFKTILLTGGNQGIGFYTVKDLALKKNVEKVIFTYRKLEDGKKAMDELINKFKVPADKLDMHQLDITKPDTIQSLYDYVKKKYGTITCLVNNAGVLFLKKGVIFEETSVDIAEKVYKVNYEGTCAMVEKFIPLIDKKNGKIINVTSMGSVMNFRNKELSDYFLNAKNRNELEEGYKKFVAVCAKGRGELEKAGYDVKHWGLAYGMSKLLMTFVTKMYADQLTKMGNGQRNVQKYCQEYCKLFEQIG